MALIFPAGSQALEAEGLGVQLSDKEFGKVDFEDGALHRLEAHVPAGQSRGSGVGVVQAGHQALVVDLFGRAFPMSRTVMMNISRSLHAQRFVRLDVVKLVAPEIQRRLPLDVFGLLHLVADVKVEALVRR